MYVDDSQNTEKSEEEIEGAWVHQVCGEAPTEG